MKKILIIVGCIFAVVIGVVLILFSGGNSQKSVAKDFAEALLINKDAVKAFSYTGEEFKAFTTLDDLKTYTKSIETKVPNDVRLKQISSEKVTSASNIPETYETKYSFSAQDIDWTLIVTTYKSSSTGVVVHAYSVSPVTNKEATEQ